MKETLVIIGASRPNARDIRIARLTDGHILLYVGPLSISMGDEADDQDDLVAQASAMRELAKRATEVANELTLRVVQVSPYAEPAVVGL